MDRQSMALLIPILALTIPVVAIIFSSLVKMTKLRAEAQRPELPHPEVEARLAALEDEIHSLRQEVLEANERMDFAERLLARRSTVPEPDQQPR